LLALTATAQLQPPATPALEPVPQRPLPVYSNPGVVIRSGLPQNGRLPETTLPEAARPSDLSRQVPVTTTLPAAFGQSRAYYSLTHPQDASATNAPSTGGVQAMLGGRLLSTGHDDITVTILKVPRYYDAEISLLAPETRLLGTNYNAGKVINLGRLPAGEIVFAVKVNSTQTIYPTGPGPRNPDGLPHAVVQLGGTTEAPLVYVGFEDLMTSQTLNRTFNDTVLQLSGGVAAAITPPVDNRAQPAAPAPVTKKKR